MVSRDKGAVKYEQIHWSWSHGSIWMMPCQKTGKRQNRTESDTEEKGEETRSHMLKEAGCGDKEKSTSMALGQGMSSKVG